MRLLNNFLAIVGAIVILSPLAVSAEKNSKQPHPIHNVQLGPRPFFFGERYAGQQTKS